MPNKFISISKIGGEWNGRQYLFHQCERHDAIRIGVSEYISPRCGGEAAYLLIQEGELTHRRFELHICAKHAQPYLERYGEDVQQPPQSGPTESSGTNQ